jgi:hypothetical protein
MMMKRRDTRLLRMPGKLLFWTIDCVTCWNLSSNDFDVFDFVGIRVIIDGAIVAKHGMRSWCLTIHGYVINVLVEVCIILWKYSS